MNTTPYFLLVSSIAFTFSFSSCTQETTFGDRLQQSADSETAIAKNWKKGDALLKTGEKQKKKGKSLIREGEDLIEKGKKSIEKGGILKKEAEAASSVKTATPSPPAS